MKHLDKYYLPDGVVDYDALRRKLLDKKEAKKNN
tara:strand:+ start:469 stop:570 length:102 start_codon:yes stop_codon:yes gene_type:complete